MTINRAVRADFPDVKVMAFVKAHDSGLPDAPYTLGNGNNSGFQAVTLAACLGASRILLTGFDMKLGPRGQVHHHGAHPAPLTNPAAERFEAWRFYFNRLALDAAARGLTIINCTPGSALDAFPMGRLEEWL